MSTEVSEDEIIEVIPYITSNLENPLEKFDCSTKQFDEQYVLYSKIFNCEDFIKSIENNLLQTEADFLSRVNGQVDKNRNYLEKINEKLEELMILQHYLLGLVSKNKEQVEAINAKIAKLNKKMQNIQEARDKIQVLKLSTGTEFTYEEKSFCGYVVNKTSREIECFELDPGSISESDLTECLYDLLKQVNHV